jgi:hypothetical protein
MTLWPFGPIYYLHLDVRVAWVLHESREGGISAYAMVRAFEVDNFDTYHFLP